MATFVIVALVIVTLLALVAILALAGAVADAPEVEATRVEVEVRRAERRLHDVARHGFAAMLEQARAHDPRAVK